MRHHTSLLATLESGERLALAALLLATASWLKIAAPLPGTAMVDPEQAVAVALAEEAAAHEADYAADRDAAEDDVSTWLHVEPLNQW
jgi:hypothetical protein